MKNVAATEHAREPIAASPWSRNIELRTIESLKSHPLHGNIYRNEDIKDLLASIENVGILTPLQIAPDGTVISGLRRLAAARQLGWSEVPVMVRTPNGKKEETDEELVEANVQRIKTNEEMVREFARHREYEKKLAKARQGRRTDRNAGLNNVRAKLPINDESGRARDIAAEKVGISSRTAVNGLAVIHAVDAHAETDQDKAKELLGVLNEKSINAAYELATNRGWIKNKSSTKNAANSKAEIPAVVVQKESADSVVSQQSASIAESSRSAVDEESSSGDSKSRAEDRGEQRHGSAISRHARTPDARKRTPASIVEIEPLDTKGRSLITSDAVLKTVCSNSRGDDDSVRALKSVVDKFVGFVTSHLGPEPSSSSVHQTVEVLQSISDILLESCSNESDSSNAVSNAE